MKGTLVVNELLSLGLSQMEIERRSGVDQTTVSALKRGTRKSTSYEKVVALEGLLYAVRAERASCEVSART
ncbi:helix-turn-helix domain-containing protein [Burkholderia glumae]|uniref:helix-turn-helix domain-containing protein n=1 Tax=Burkholderia glumae TaxID=337 RepID=UPI003B9795C0